MKGCKCLYRVLSLLLLFIFSINLCLDYSFAYMDSIGISPKIGQINETYKGTSGKTIFIIPNIHCNKESQEKTSQIITNLKKYYKNQLRVIGLEGSVGEINISIFNKFRDKKIKNNVVNNLLSNGYLTGVELYSINNPKEKMYIHGIEDKNLYRSNFKSLYYSLFYYEDVKQELQKLKNVIDRTSNMLYPEKLKDFIRKENLYKSGKVSLSVYLNYLMNKSLEYNVGNKYIQINNYLKIQNLDVNIKYIENKNYVNNFKILNEIDDLSYVLKTKILNDTGDLKDILYCQVYLDVFVKYLKNEADVNTVVKWGQNREKFYKEMEYIFSKIYYKNIFREYENKIMNADNNMTEFYSIANKRNEILVNNTLNLLNENKSNIGIMVCGGFHLNGITEILRNRGISYQVIAPAVNNFINNKIYIKRLNEQAFLSGIKFYTKNSFANIKHAFCLELQSLLDTDVSYGVIDNKISLILKSFEENGKNLFDKEYFKDAMYSIVKNSSKGFLYLNPQQFDRYYKCKYYFNHYNDDEGSILEVFANAFIDGIIAGKITKELHKISSFRRWCAVFTGIYVDNGITEEKYRNIIRNWIINNMNDSNSNWYNSIIYMLISIIQTKGLELYDNDLDYDLWKQKIDIGRDITYQDVFSLGEFLDIKIFTNKNSIPNNNGCFDIIIQEKDNDDACMTLRVNDDMQQYVYCRDNDLRKNINTIIRETRLKVSQKKNFEQQSSNNAFTPKYKCKTTSSPEIGYGAKSPFESPYRRANTYQSPTKFLSSSSRTKLVDERRRKEELDRQFKILNSCITSENIGEIQQEIEQHQAQQYVEQEAQQNVEQETQQNVEQEAQQNVQQEARQELQQIQNSNDDILAFDSQLDEGKGNKEEDKNVADDLTVIPDSQLPKNEVYKDNDEVSKKRKRTSQDIQLEHQASVQADEATQSFHEDDNNVRKMIKIEEKSGNKDSMLIDDGSTQPYNEDEDSLSFSMLNAEFEGEFKISINGFFKTDKIEKIINNDPSKINKLKELVDCMIAVKNIININTRDEYVNLINNISKIQNILIGDFELIYLKKDILHLFNNLVSALGKYNYNSGIVYSKTIKEGNNRKIRKLFMNGLMIEEIYKDHEFQPCNTKILYASEWDDSDTSSVKKMVIEDTIEVALNIINIFKILTIKGIKIKIKKLKKYISYLALKLLSRNDVDIVSLYSLTSKISYSV
jgi:hypothetical protein